jgi:hypothetical protein
MPPKTTTRRAASKVEIKPGPAPVTISGCYFEISPGKWDDRLLAIAQTVADGLLRMARVFPEAKPPMGPAIHIGNIEEK